MKRGEIYYAALEPSIGAETKKIRPVVIVSNNISNCNSELVTVLPITSNIVKVYPFEVFLAAKMSGLKKDSKALAQQIRTLSKLRCKKNRMGELSSNIMKQIDDAIKLHLAL